MRCIAVLLLATAAFAQDHLEEALVKAGKNRGELEKVLAHFKDPEKLAAAKFLIENMPGHGYVITRLVAADGTTIPYDPLDYPNFKAALAKLDELEKKHGAIDFKRDGFRADIETMTADYLIRHIDNAFVVWKRTPEHLRVSFDAFCNFVLPYRGSQEPIEDWLTPLMKRYAHTWTKKGEPNKIARGVSKDLRRSVRFNERYYLHPTDQSFSEMLMTGQGRCEDLTNLSTYAFRSIGVAVAADYTPWWAHRDNNHAWDVLLDKEGIGFAKSNAHAAKIYRKTYAIQRNNLCFQLPEGREAPNRFLKSEFYYDVTDQYAATTDVTVSMKTEEKFAYLCVFNGGVWKAIQWARVEDGKATFERMGRNIVYLPMIHDGKALLPIAAPLLVLREGEVVALPGKGIGTTVDAISVHPKKVSPDTGEVTPTSFLKAGTVYLLKRWDDGWRDVAERTAGKEPLRFEGLPGDGLYWLVEKESRRLERVFTIENGRQRWW
ncbi:MAG: transglutaminase domain-containing protein [Planctomycetota bacterium]|jgi:hypothetical protein